MDDFIPIYMVSRGVQGCPGVLHVHAGTFENS